MVEQLKISHGRKISKEKINPLILSLFKFKYSDYKEAKRIQKLEPYDGISY